MDIRTYPDRDMMMVDVADQLASELAERLRSHESATFAVPGGTTPGPIFDMLSAQHLDWPRCHVMLTDERWVPEDDVRSNTRLVRERLLTGPAASAVHVPLYLPGDRPEDRLDEIAAGMEGRFPISVLVLGMGEDMHTASLFPGSEGLEAALSDRAPPILPVRPASTSEVRVTLTAPVLKGAMSTHIVITGEAKREALERARHLPVAEAPVRLVLGGAVVHWAG